MRFALTTGWLLTTALAMPAAIFAQGVVPAPAERVLSDDPDVTNSYVRLPVAMDNSQPGEASWAQKAVTLPTEAPAPDSPAAAALQQPAQPECCPQGEQQSKHPFIKRLLAIPRQPWQNSQFFTRGQLSVEVLTGFFQSPPYVFSTRQTFFVPAIVRLGLGLTDPDQERRWLKGSFTGLAEFDCLPVTYGVGSIVLGGSGILRYYPTPCKNQRMVSYFQAGFGGSWGDAYLNPISPTTSPFNFITQVGMGMHFFLRCNLAITNETNFYRISFPSQGGGGNPEAPQVTHPGFNIIGSTIGLTYFFGRPCSDRNCCN